ncbi:hypothetical protein Scep_001263 [Stephania cephalantha]|uniref:Uncharacterized protein n=1 Tax=Stephania cephalantha TaxID=152367 RepID=A0AAP0Q367_9MAGN
MKKEEKNIFATSLIKDAIWKVYKISYCVFFINCVIKNCELSLLWRPKVDLKIDKH